MISVRMFRLAFLLVALVAAVSASRNNLNLVERNKCSKCDFVAQPFLMSSWAEESSEVRRPTLDSSRTRRRSEPPPTSTSAVVSSSATSGCSRLLTAPSDVPRPPSSPLLDLCFWTLEVSLTRAPRSSTTQTTTRSGFRMSKLEVVSMIARSNKFVAIQCLCRPRCCSLHPQRQRSASRPRISSCRRWRQRHRFRMGRHCRYWRPSTKPAAVAHDHNFDQRWLPRSSHCWQRSVRLRPQDLHLHRRRTRHLPGRFRRPLGRSWTSYRNSLVEHSMR